MAMELKKYKLGEIVDFNKCSISKSESIQDIIYLDTSSITENVIGETVALNITEAPSRAQRKVTNNTIIYSTVRPRLKHYGILSNPKYNFIVSTGFVTIDLKDAYKDKIDPRYLYLLLTQPIITEYVGNIADTAVSAYPSINSSDLLSLSFNFPSYDTQKTVADIWANYDQKIELNRAINHNLEAMAKQLYDYWFVQFDFPNEEGKPYKSSGGKMVWNEKLKREIPEGWEVASIVDNPLSSVIKPGVNRFSSKEYLATAEINGTLISSGNIVDYETREGRANMQPTINSVWFAKMKNSIKHLFLNNEMQPVINETILSTGFCGIQCSDNSFEYISSFVSSDYFETIKDLLAHGATQEAVNNEDMQSILLLIPNDEVLLCYHKTCKSLYAQISKNICENRELTVIRDYLLPLLMNGQVSVLNSD